MSRCLSGLDVCIGAGADDAGKALALQQAKQPVARSGDSDGGTSWATIGGIALAIVVAAVALPKIMRYTSGD